MTYPRHTPQYDRVLVGKSINAQVEERPAFRLTSPSPPDKHEPRFGTRLASYLLILELSMLRRLDEYDVEWFEGELLRRLRDHFVTKPGTTEGEIGGYDLWAGKYDYGGTDIDCSLHFGKRRYQELLTEILSALFQEEGASGQITAIVLKTFRIPWPARPAKHIRVPLEMRQ